MRYWTNAVSSHVIALFATFIYGIQIAFSKYNSTALMFVTPVLVMLLVYWAAEIVARGKPVSAERILGNLALGGALQLGFVAVLLLTLPAPSGASGPMDSGATIGSVLICLTILAIVIAIIVALIKGLFKFLRLMFNLLIKGRWPDDKSLHDYGALIAASCVLAAMSLEGLPLGYSFSQDGLASSEIKIPAAPQAVWQAMSSASSPQLDLPLLLSMLPHPVAVQDEGSNAGAKRIVHFEGREGGGKMALVAQARQGDSVTWQVTEDTTPLAKWAKLQSIEYAVQPNRTGTTRAKKLPRGQS